jgi:hypothetical protein
MSAQPVTQPRLEPEASRTQVERVASVQACSMLAKFQFHAREFMGHLPRVIFYETIQNEVQESKADTKITDMHNDH